MKRLFLPALVLILGILLAAGCSHRPAFAAATPADDEKAGLTLDDASFFSDFHIRDGRVFYDCVLVIDNPKGCPAVELTGTFPDDVGVLVREDALKAFSLNLPWNPSGFPAYDGASLTDTVIPLSPGRNRIAVVFIGTHAGSTQKADRLLPEIRYSVP